MRYYFHLHNETDRMVDETGLELADPQQLRAQAIKALQEISKDDPELTEEGSGWTLTVTDNSGNVLFSIALDNPNLPWPEEGSAICNMLRQ